MSRGIRKLLVVLSLVALGGSTACIVRHRHGHDRHQVRHHDNGKKRGHYKKHKKHRKHKKHKKHRKHRRHRR